MARFGNQSRFLIATLCVVMLVLRVSGLHVHLCMDGTEPPMSFHVEDAGIHHLDEASAGDEHADRDFSLASDVVVKKPQAGLDLTLAAAFCALLLFMLARPRKLFAFPSLPAKVRSARTRLRPPLRGPPRLA
jgi:hypothetical protein